MCIIIWFLHGRGAKVQVDRANTIHDSGASHATQFSPIAAEYEYISLSYEEKTVTTTTVTN